MKKSIVYAKVRIVVEHPADVDPQDAVNECKYSFEASIKDGYSGTITETEMTEIENHGEIDPETGALKPPVDNDPPSRSSEENNMTEDDFFPETSRFYDGPGHRHY